MVEHKIVVDEVEVGYEGIFNLSEVYKIIEDWLADNNYDKEEVLNVEYLKPEGKYIELLLEPNKKVSDYVKNIIRIAFVAKNIKDVDIKEDGVKKKMQEGKLSLAFTAILETDYEGRWEQRPTFYFLKIIVDKYVYKFYTDKFESIITKDINDLMTQVKSFLNLYKFK